MKRCFAALWPGSLERGANEIQDLLIQGSGLRACMGDMKGFEQRFPVWIHIPVRSLGLDDVTASFNENFGHLVAPFAQRADG